MKIFFIPYLLSVPLICGLYSFALRLMEIKFHEFYFGRITTLLYIPIFVAGIISILFFRSGIKKCTIHSPKKRRGWMYMMFVFILIPLICFQFYISLTVYPLIQIKTIGELSGTGSRYYKIDNYKLADKKNALVSPYVYTSRTRYHGSNLHFELYYFLPFLSGTDNDAILGIWYCKKYEKVLPNSLSSYEKDAAWELFVVESQYNFDTCNLYSGIQYFEFFGHETTRFHKLIANKINKPQTADKMVILEPIKSNFEERSGKSILPFAVSYAILSILVLFSALKLKFKKEYQ